MPVVAKEPYREVRLVFRGARQIVRVVRPNTIVGKITHVGPAGAIEPFKPHYFSCVLLCAFRPEGHVDFCSAGCALRVGYVEG